MDKYEFERKVQKGEDLMDDRDFEGAVAIFDELNLNLVEQPRRLQNIADAYEKCRRYEDAEDILVMALEMTPKSRGLLERLCKVALKNGGIDAAKDYYQEFCQIAKNDPARLILEYRIAVAENAPDTKLIRILERYKREEPDDRWLYELAELYARNDRYEEAAQVCDDIDLWFNSGKYLDKAHALRDQLTGMPNVPEDAVPTDPYKEEFNDGTDNGLYEMSDENAEAEGDFSEEESAPEENPYYEENAESNNGQNDDLNVTSEKTPYEAEKLNFPYQLEDEIAPEAASAETAETDLYAAPAFPVVEPTAANLAFELDVGEMRTEVQRFFSEDRYLSPRPVHSTVDEVAASGVFAADDLYSFEGFTAPSKKSELLQEAEAAVLSEIEREEEDATITAPDEHVVFSVTKAQENGKASSEKDDEVGLKLDSEELFDDEAADELEPAEEKAPEKPKKKSFFGWLFGKKSAEAEDADKDDDDDDYEDDEDKDDYDQADGLEDFSKDDNLEGFSQTEDSDDDSAERFGRMDITGEASEEDAREEDARDEDACDEDARDDVDLDFRSEKDDEPISAVKEKKEDTDLEEDDPFSNLWDDEDEDSEADEIIEAIKPDNDSRGVTYDDSNDEEEPADYLNFDSDDDQEEDVLSGEEPEEADAFAEESDEFAEESDDFTEEDDSTEESDGFTEEDASAEESDDVDESAEDEFIAPAVIFDDESEEKDVNGESDTEADADSAEEFADESEDDSTDESDEESDTESDEGSDDESDTESDAEADEESADEEGGNSDEVIDAEEDDEADESENAGASEVKPAAENFFDELEIDGEEEEEDEEESEVSKETIEMLAEEERIKDEEKLFGLPYDRGVTKGTWHFLVYGKNAVLTLQCAREKMKEISERNADCPSKLLKITSEKIGSASIRSALSHFVGNMVIVEQAASLSPKQLQEFSEVLSKDDRSLLVAFTDTRANILTMLKKIPELKKSFTAVFEGKQYTEQELFRFARLTAFRNHARMTEGAEDFMLDFCDDLLEDKQGFYEYEIERLIKKAMVKAEKGGFLGIGAGKKDEEGYLLIGEKYFRKAEAE